MIRKIIKIDEEKCNGCGACAAACHEGAIEMVNGKARLTREDYCDGLGDCLPACPTGAITFEERDAPAYNEEAVLKAKQEKKPLPCGCPGTQSKAINRSLELSEVSAPVSSQLSQWPVQIKLVPTNAPYFDGGVVKNRRLFSESSEIADRYIEILTLTHRIKEKLLNLYFL